MGQVNAARTSVPLTLELDDQRWSVAFSLDGSLFSSDLPDAELPSVRSGNEIVPLLDYLNSAPLHLYTAEFSLVIGGEIFQAPDARAGGRQLDLFDPAGFRTIDWEGAGVNIENEFAWTGKPRPDGKLDPTCIHGHLARYLEDEGFMAVCYDHGSGEMADFIVIEEVPGGEEGRWTRQREERDSVHAIFLHVKGAGGASPGNRVGDAYEVCGQVVKSLMWVQRRREVPERLRSRCKGKSAFLAGDLAAARELLSQSRRPIIFHLALVQPGITAANVEPKIQRILASADDYVRRAVGTPMTVVCSP